MLRRHATPCILLKALLQHPKLYSMFGSITENNNQHNSFRQQWNMLQPRSSCSGCEESTELVSDVAWSLVLRSEVLPRELGAMVVHDSERVII